MTTGAVRSIANSPVHRATADRVIAGCLGALLTLAAASPAAELGAQAPWAIEVPDRGAPPAPPATVPTAADRRADLERKLAEIRAQLARLPAAPVPAGVSPQEKEQRRRLLDDLAFRYQAQMRTLAALEDARKLRESAETREHAWTGFSEPPPYSILLLDQLQDAADAARDKVRALHSALGVLEDDALQDEADAKRSAAALRVATESVDHAKPHAERALGEWRRDVAQLRDRLAQNELALSSLGREMIAERLAAAQSDLRLAERQIAAARPETVFSQADLDKVRRTTQTNVELLEAKLESLRERGTRAVLEHEDALRAMEEPRAGGRQSEAAGRASTALPQSEAKARAAQAQAENVQFETDTLNALLTMHRKELEHWEDRFILQSSEDPDLRRQALHRSQLALTRLKPWRTYVSDRIAVARSDELRQDARLDSLDPGAPSRRYEQLAFDAYQERRTMLEGLQVVTDRVERHLQRWLQEYEAARGMRSLTDRLVDGLAEARDWARQIWGFELFTVDEKVEIEGREVKTSRGITFGKSIGALLLFVAGYGLSAFLARRVQRVMVRRFSFDEPQANVMRRWFLAIATALLLIIVLNLVHIPLTVFAFLGGALAIGVGFGTQTLLKNLISGVMVLMERKVKVGDIVDVGGIVGTVTEIDIRSSTIRGFDGVETMIPNSSFLENNVTNWTYTTPRLRRSVQVGVAYGSAVRHVSNVLEDCARRHGLVLQDPAPFVLLEEFGDNALVFGLYFWLEMTPNVSALQIASDLRFMIEKGFSEEGIVIAFPQREILLDTRQPLRVEMVHPGDLSADGSSGAPAAA